MKGQTKADSLIEALTNIAVGIGVAFVRQIIIFQLYHIPVSLTQNAEMTCWFTLASLVRSFCLRRLFNWRTYRRELEREATEWAREPWIKKKPASFLEAANREFEKRMKEGKL